MLKSIESFFFGDTFNTRIKVRFINYANDTLIEVLEFPQEYLPESFAEPISVFIENKEWQIVRAEPLHANQYSFDKRLTLWIKDPIEVMLKMQADHPAESKIRFGISTPSI